MTLFPGCGAMRERPMQASEIMKRNPVTVKESDPIFKAVREMVDYGVTGLPVVDNDGQLAGIVTEKDVLRLLYTFSDISRQVSKFMTPNPVAFSTQTPIEELCECFRRNAFRRVPILDNGRLVGVVSRKDIIAAIYQHRNRPPGE